MAIDLRGKSHQARAILCLQAPKERLFYINCEHLAPSIWPRFEQGKAPLNSPEKCSRASEIIGDSSNKLLTSRRSKVEFASRLLSEQFGQLLDGLCIDILPPSLAPSRRPNRPLGLRETPSSLADFLLIALDILTLSTNQPKNSRSSTWAISHLSSPIALLN